MREGVEIKVPVGGVLRRLSGPKGPLIQLVLIAAVGLAVYSNTMDVPFQFDDMALLSGNPIIKDLSNFLESSRARVHPEYGLFKRRIVSFFTFALNFKAHGLDVGGYHIVNTAIHILNAFLVYTLVMLTFRTPFFSSSPFVRHGALMALLMGLLFVCHPVQTEAVTYITQRFASLAAFFYLLSLIFYIKWRLASNVKFQISSFKFYLLSLLSAFLAMKTKENALTLPFAIALYEISFFRGRIMSRVLAVVPAFLLLILFPLSLIETGLPAPLPIDRAVQGNVASVFEQDYIAPPFSPWEYFITQPRVLMTYLRLLVLPVGQNLDYDYPVYGSPFAAPVFYSLSAIALIFGAAIYCYCLSRRGNPALRLVSFGILWFFLTISVESSIIPIPMLIAEYRLYLPSTGIFLAVLSALFMFLEGHTHRRANYAASTVLAITLLTLLSGAAYARNNVWRTEQGLWEDVVKKSPWKARGHFNLSLACKKAGQKDRALKHGLVAVRLKPEYAGAHNNLALLYESLGARDRAITHYNIALRLKPFDPVVHNNVSIAYASHGLLEKAIEHSKTAVRLRPDYVEASFNLGLCYLQQGAYEAARKAFGQTLRFKPDHRLAGEFLRLLEEPRRP